MHQPFTYQQDSLCCDGVALADIARAEGTPCYVYSKQAILDRFHAYDRAFGAQSHKVCYAVKANSNLSLLRVLSEAGAGFDIVSGGELFRVLKAGADPAKVVFSGVGKTAAEVEYAINCGIHTFNCESEAELALIDSIAARLGAQVRVALRVNPDVDAETHPYISTGLSDHKFGVDMSAVEGVYSRAKGFPRLLLEGVSCHIGSQILDTRPVMEAVDKMVALVDRLRADGVPIRHLDLGGGLGVAYNSEQVAPDIEVFIQKLVAKSGGRDLELLIEPGRSIVGDAGLMLTRVLYRKLTPQKEFVVVDAGMNDLIRPSLYQSHHEIIPLRRNPLGTILADVVGPVCESGDFLARGRQMANVFPGDYLAVCTAGAYGFVLASNYNSRARPAEVMVDGGAWKVVRQRETLEDLVRGE